jgi:hypothetical protein
MNAFDYVLAMTSIADTREGFERLGDALLDIDQSVAQADTKKAPEPSGLPEKHMQIHQAEAMKGGFVPVSKSAGQGVRRVCICLSSRIRSSSGRDRLGASDYQINEMAGMNVALKSTYRKNARTDKTYR